MCVLKFLVINTHRGFIKVDRLPFGVKMCPGIFQQAWRVEFCYLDEFLIKSETHEEHIEHIHEVFKPICFWTQKY